MADEKKSWWKTVLAFVGGFVLGVVSFVRLRRTGISGSIRQGADDVGHSVSEVVGGISGAEKRAEESVRLASELGKSGNDIGKSIEKLTVGSDAIGGAVSEARESVGRLKELIRQERERIGKP